MTQRDEATQRQIEAADPRNSTWLAANAGSGKTRVLTDRVARLLLDGVDPQNILCLTYTKAAASEMQNRLFRRLGGWSMRDDSALRDELLALGIEDRITPELLAEARRLFARAIETPGGLKIQTIHSFCAGLLRRFPLEAGISPQFAEMDDRLALRLRTEVVDAIAMGPDCRLLDAVLRHHTGATLDDLLQDILSRRAAFENAPDVAALTSWLGLAPGSSLEKTIEQVFQPDTGDVITNLIALCRRGKTSDITAAERLTKVNVAAPSRRDLLRLEQVCLYGKGAAKEFQAKLDSIPTADLRKTEPELAEEVNALMLRVQRAREQRLALETLTRTLDLHAFACRFLHDYEDRKLLRGALDFDDLIRKARQLLTDDAVAQWVLFRLDGGIDHILVDEAQDTSPDQWQVIERLSQEFAAGSGTRPDRQRTIFVVGDRKQSIYSFQGADAEAFDAVLERFETRAGALNRLDLAHSFRSSPDILQVVDQTFVGDQRDGLGDYVFHRAFNEAMPGRVDLWPPVPASDDKDDRVWTDPLDRPSRMHHDRILAVQIADSISEMVKTGTIPAKSEDGAGYVQRPIRAGDFLILVQRRRALFHEIIRACKAAGLPIAGADRLRVGGELAVRDIGAVLKFLALPEDDLSLACALRSPLFGWDEPALYALAQGRPQGQYLWQGLRDTPDHAATRAILDDLRDQADFLRPYDLVMRLLVHHGGRHALIARLGAEAEDGIDALLAQALAYEGSEVPSLTGFIEWMDTDAQEIKRTSDAIGDRIRVMTVHGAKGLEAPIVILPETMLLKPRSPGAVLGRRDEALWGGTVEDLPPALRDLRADAILAQERERRRLLYVAMTRAESWLIVCGAGNMGEGCQSWHGTVAAGMVRAGAVSHPFHGQDGLRFGCEDWSALPLTATRAAARTPFWPTAPDPLAAPLRADRAFSPSDLGGAKVLAADDDSADPEVALARGRLMHLLLEHLPAMPPDRQPIWAESLLHGSEDGEFVADSAALIAEAMALVASETLSHVFGPSALAEVDVTAPWPGRDRRLHGTIDRLLIAQDGITIIDFKTNRLVPDTPADVPEGLLRQMGAYLVMLRQIYPDMPVNLAILWTSACRLMPVPPESALAAFDRAPVP